MSQTFLSSSNLRPSVFQLYWPCRSRSSESPDATFSPLVLFLTNQPAFLLIHLLLPYFLLHLTPHFLFSSSFMVYGGFGIGNHSCPMEKVASWAIRHFLQGGVGVAVVVKEFRLRYLCTGWDRI